MSAGCLGGCRNGWCAPPFVVATRWVSRRCRYAPFAGLDVVARRLKTMRSRGGLSLPTVSLCSLCGNRCGARCAVFNATRKAKEHVFHERVGAVSRHAPALMLCFGRAAVQVPPDAFFGAGAYKKTDGSAPDGVRIAGNLISKISALCRLYGV